MFRAALRRGPSRPAARLRTGREEPLERGRQELSVPWVEAGPGGDTAVSVSALPDESTETGLPCGSWARGRVRPGRAGPGGGCRRVRRGPRAAAPGPGGRGGAGTQPRARAFTAAVCSGGRRAAGAGPRFPAGRLTGASGRPPRAAPRLSRPLAELEVGGRWCRGVAQKRTE